MQLQKYLVEALSTECFSSSFPHRLKKSTKSWSFDSLLRGRDTTLFTPVDLGYFKSLYLAVAGQSSCSWGQPWIWYLTGFGSQTIWLKLPAPKAPAPDAAEDRQPFNTGEACTHERSCSAFRAKSHFMAWSFRILIHWRVNTWILHGKKAYVHTWDSQDSTKQLFCIHQWNSAWKLTSLQD